MEILSGMLVLVLVIALALTWQWLVSKVTRSANRQLYRRANSEGRELVARPARFAAHAPISAVLESVWHGVRAQPQAPLAVIAETYRTEKTEARLEWRHGNRLSTTFVAVLVATEQDGITEVSLQFRDVQEIDGVIAGVSAMRALRHDVKTALAQLAPAR